MGRRKVNTPQIVRQKRTRSEDPGKTLATSVGSLSGSKSARMLATIKRDMDLKGALMRRRRRNEEVLSLAYMDGTMIGGADQIGNLREYSLNLPYRYARWVESQATSKRMSVRVSRDAGEGQKPSGPADNQTGMWVGIALERIAYEAGFYREMRAAIGEVIPRGTSVIEIGYHQEVISLDDAKEVGKDAQSVMPDVLAHGDVEAKPGQAHAEIAEGLGAMASDETFQAVAGTEAVDALLARKSSHEEASYAEETDYKPIESVRLTRRKLWLKKRRVGEDCGWSPHVYDVADAGMWWSREVWSVAEIKAATNLFTQSYRDKVKGYDARNVSGVSSGGQTASTDNMGSDARQAQGEDILDDDERSAEFFVCWCKRPDMKSNGLRLMVSAEVPDEFIQLDDANPHVDVKGFGVIPGFFPFYDFTPIHPPITVPERTCGIAPMSVGMPQFEQIAEMNRLLRESALRHSLRLYEIHPSLKNKKELLNALRNGTDGYAYVAEEGQRTVDGKITQGVTPIQFSGNTLDVERLVSRLEGDWVKAMGMPPAILQGVGTAETATQDRQGIAAGEAESGAIIEYLQVRTADMLAGLRGLMRVCYDDEDFIALLGQEGADVIKAWQTGTADDGDEIHVTFGVGQRGQEVVDRKQIMEAITLEKAEIEPITGLPKYDPTALFEELHRMLGVGPPKVDDTPMRKLQQIVLTMLTQAQGQPGAPGGGGGGPPSGNKPPAGPNPAEGDGPSESNLNAGAFRGAVENQTAGA